MKLPVFTACSSAVNIGCFSYVLSGFLYIVLLENNLLWLLNGRTTTHKPLILDFMKDLECLWNTNSEHYRNEADREKALEETVQELKFLNPP
jgi:hypothetical protein